jgi:zinc transporter
LAAISSDISFQLRFCSIEAWNRTAVVRIPISAGKLLDMPIRHGKQTLNDLMKSDLLLQTYGADSSGMVCGFLFSSTVAGRPVDADEVVNDVMFNLEFIPSEIATLWIYANQRIIITARLKSLRSVDRLRASVREGEIFRSPAQLLVHLMRDQADLLVQIVRRTSADVDRIEDRFLSQRPTQNRLDLGAMRRMLTRLQRMLAPEPGAIFRLLARPPRWLQQEDVQDLRESTEEFSVVLSDVAGLIERVRLLQEEIISRLEEQNNRTLFTLTLVTVLAMPINIVAGFFGMNVGGIPFAENRHGFWVMVLLVAGFTGLAGWWAFRRRKER